MKTRKLIKWGSSNTLILSLPRKWIKENNLTPNDMVSIRINPDGTLTIIPLTYSEEEHLVSNIPVKDSDDIEYIRLRIFTNYLDGYDIIKLTADRKVIFDRRMRKKIDEIIEPLMGLQIIGFNRSEIIIKNLVDIAAENFFNLIRMISDFTLEMGLMLKEYITEGAGHTEDISALFDDIRKFTRRCQRELRKSLLRPVILDKMGINLQDVMDYAFYINNVFRIAEAFEYLGESINKYGLGEDNFGVFGYYGEIYNIVKDAVDAFLFKESKRAILIIKKIKKIKPEKREIENKVDIAEKELEPKLLIFQIILDISEKILDYCYEICLAALRRAF